MMLTLGYFLVVTQTMTPSIKTSVTFKGCGPKSFTGFPLESDGHYKGLQYITCVALRIRSKTVPWNILPKINRENLRETMKKTMIKLKEILINVILKNEEIKQKIYDKQLYIKKHGDSMEQKDNGDQELNDWHGFLPPLNSYSISESKKQLNKTPTTDILEGDSAQFKKINAIKGTIDHYSFSIIEKIQKGVNKAVLLLDNHNNDKIIQNACCNDGSVRPLEYFNGLEGSIIPDNDVVLELEKRIENINNMTDPYYLTDPLNTKHVYQIADTVFSEVNIYEAFIKHCKFNSGIILSEEYNGICANNTSDFKEDDSINTKISILKSEHNTFDNESLELLMNIINKKNILPIDITINIPSPEKRFIDYISEEPYDIEIVDVIKTYIDDRSTVNGEELSQLLIGRIIEFKTKILLFLNDNANPRGLEEFFNNFDLWKITGENIYINNIDETAVTHITFINTFIDNIINVYPNIIKNTISGNTCPIPNHWTRGSSKLSDIHVNDIKNIISAEYVPFEKWHHNKSIDKLLATLGENKTLHFINEIRNMIPFYSHSPGESRRDILFTSTISKNIMSYLFLIVLDVYIESIHDIIIDDLELEEEESEVLDGLENQLNKHTASLMVDILTLMHKNKKTINKTNREINEKVLKDKEREKSKITEGFGNLTREARQTEDLMKNHRIGKWGVGQTKALYEYNPDQYDRERGDNERESVEQFDVNSFDAIDNHMADSEANGEINDDIMGAAEDDDFIGDGDELY
jgi:hypothetical protein